MNARRDSSDEPSRGSFGGRLLLTAAVLFALAATGALILTDEQRWLRLGIVAALWAALAGAFLAARYRRQVADQEEVLADRQERYELELEREIAARREYELQVAAEARREADEAARDDIAALRQELFGLRQTLESLLGGEFLVERYALRAESTRMRSLPDDRQLKRLPPALSKEDNIIPAVVQEAQTDLIDRIREASQAPKRKVEPMPRRTERPGGRPEFPVPEHTPHPSELSDRWFVPDGLGTGQPQPQPKREQQTQYMAGPNGPEGGGKKPKKAAKENRRAKSEPAGGLHSSVASGYVEPVSRPRADANGVGPGTSGYVPPVGSGYRGAAESSGYVPPVGSGFGSSAARAESSGYVPPGGRAEASGYGSAVGRPEASGYVPPVGSGFGSSAARAESSGYGSPVGRAESSGYVAPAGQAESSGYRSPVGRAGSSGYPPGGRAERSGYGSPVSRAESSGYVPPVGRAESSGYGSPVGRAESSGYVPPVGRPEPSNNNGSAAARADSSGYVPPAGWAQSSGYTAPVHAPRRQTGAEPPDPAGGRRRRAEGQPTWQESRQNGSAEAEPSGSHAAGRSVSELLASHGGGRSPSTPRRRRRKD